MKLFIVKRLEVSLVGCSLSDITNVCDVNVFQTKEEAEEYRKDCFYDDLYSYDLIDEDEEIIDIDYSEVDKDNFTFSQWSCDGDGYEVKYEIEEYEVR